LDKIKHLFIGTVAATAFFAALTGLCWVTGKLCYIVFDYFNFNLPTNASEIIFVGLIAWFFIVFVTICLGPVLIEIGRSIKESVTWIK